MKKNVFIVTLMAYMVAFNLLIINAVGNTGALTNIITGNVVFLSKSPASDPQFLLPLFLFNLAIIGFFAYSYNNFNLYSKKTRRKAVRA